MTHEQRENAKHCGVSKATAHQITSTHNLLGVATVETQGKGGRQHEYLTLEEVQQFLAPFFPRAQAGEIATATEVKQALERRVDHEVKKTTMYRLLDRHCRRQMIPRPRYPMDKEAQEQHLPHN